MIALSSPDSDLVKLVEEGGIDSLREGLALGCPVGLLGYDDGCDDGSDDGCPLGGVVGIDGLEDGCDDGCNEGCIDGHTLG